MATQLGSIKRVRKFPGFVVDGFNYQTPDVCAYFLTHYHADHTCGLHAGFKGPAKIYCTEITAALITNVMGVKPQFVVPVPMHTEIVINTAGRETAFVTFLDANHCPGSATIYFRKPSGDGVKGGGDDKQSVFAEGETNSQSQVTALHTGDFRAARCVREDKHLHELIKKNGPVGELYLDTTYCDPRWRFPDQREVLATIGTIAKNELKREPNTLFLVGSYSIGKERAVRAVATAVRSAVNNANSKVLVSWQRARTLKLTGWWDDDVFVTEGDEFETTRDGEKEPRNEPADASASADADADADASASASASVSASSGKHPEPPFRVRVSAMGGGGAHKDMLELLQTLKDPKTKRPYFAAVVSFRPTGWCYSKRLERHASLGAGVENTVENEADLFDLKGTRAAERYAPWVENDGTTRVYQVPYSEHSSFPELVSFVERIKPSKITPTVNAGSETQKRKILKHFAHLTCSVTDTGRLEHYFGQGGTGCSGGGGKRKAQQSLDDAKGDAIRVKTEKGFEQIEEEKGNLQIDETTYPGVCPETIDALRGILTPSEFKEQLQLLKEAEVRKTIQETKEEQDPAQTPFPLGCVVVVKGGGGGFGGGGARYQQFKDRQHVESRLKQLGALVVGRVSQKVTHVVVPGSGEALSEERRRHGCDPETGARAFLSLVEKVEKYGNGVAKFGAVSSSEPCPVGVSEAVTPSEASPPVFVKSEPVDSQFDAAVSHTKSVVSHTASAASHTAASTHTQVQVVTEGWVMRHWRAFQNGTAKTHAAEDVANHKRKLAAEKQEEKEQKKMAQKLKKEAIEFGGDDARPGRFRNLNKQALDKIAKALSQRLFFLGRKDVTRGDHPTTGQRLGTDTGTTKRTADATTLGPKQKWRALFRVFGTAGTAYECDVSEFPACSCPEFVEARRAGHGSPGAHVCGHLTWLLVRVLGVSTDDPVLCQTALTQRELAGILAPRKNMQAEGGLGTLEPDESTRACPVCRSAIVDATSAGTTSFDESLTPKNSNPVEGGKKQQSDAKVLVAPCPNGCAGFVHASCTRRFAEMRNEMEGIKRAAGCETTMAATCPLCETGWVEQDSHGLAVAP